LECRRGKKERKRALGGGPVCPFHTLLISGEKKKKKEGHPTLEKGGRGNWKRTFFLFQHREGEKKKGKASFLSIHSEGEGRRKKGPQKEKDPNNSAGRGGKKKKKGEVFLS